MRRIHRYLIFTGLTLITILGIIESDAFVRMETINWDANKPISWGNFRGYPHYFSKYAAAIYSTFKYEILNDNFDSIKVNAYMLPHHSWTKKIDIKPEYTLQHEQYHFNLTEAIARKFKKELSKIPPKDLSKRVVQRLYYQHLSQLTSLQQNYDENTDHSLILERQKDWEYIIDSLLNSYSYYISPIVRFIKDPEANQIYYRQIDLGTRHQIKGKYPVDSALAIYTRCYKFNYQNNKLSKIEYRDRNRPAIDHFFNASSVVFKNTDSCEYRYYFNIVGKRVKNMKGSYATLITRQENKIRVTTLDEGGQKDENRTGFCTLEWMLDDKGRKSTGTFYNKRGEIITNSEGFYTIEYRYDENDNIIEINNLNSENKLQNLKNGIASYRYLYDEKGNMKMYQTINDTLKQVSHRKSISTANFLYDIDGNTICESFQKSDGSPYIDEDGVFVTYFKYDENENITEEKQYGLNKNLIISEERKGKVERNFDKYGRVVEIRNFDAYDNYLNDNQGRCKIKISYLAKHLIYEQKIFHLDSAKSVSFLKAVRYIYDDDENVQSEIFYDEDDNLLLDKDGVCFIKYKYDIRGNLTQKAYYNSNKELLPISHGVAILKYLYDKRNNKIKTSYFDKNGNLKETVNDIAIDKYSYNDDNQPTERSSWNSKDILTKNSDSVEIIRWDDDTRGNEIRESYFNSKGVLAANSGGIAFIEYEYDNKSNRTEKRYFNRNSEFVDSVNSGIAIEKYEFSKDNDIVKEYFFDRDNKLINSPEGYAIQINSYDKNRRIIRRHYLSKDEQPVVTSYGYSSITWRYDNNNNTIVVIYRDENGKLIEDEDGYAGYNWVHDRNGDVVKSYGFGADEKNILSLDLGPFNTKIDDTSRINYFARNRIRVQTTYYKNGQKSSEVTYRNNKLEGTYTSWYKSGKIESEIGYRHGKRNGTTMEYYKNGQMSRRMEYKDNLIVAQSEATWYENGNIRSLYADGKHIEYSIDGEITDDNWKN